MTSMTAKRPRPRVYHKNPCLTFALGLILGALLDRQVMLGMDCRTSASNEGLLVPESLEYPQHTSSTEPINKSFDCPVSEPCPERTLAEDARRIPCPAEHSSHKQHQAHHQAHQTQSTTSIRQLQQSLLFPHDSIHDLIAGMSRVSRDEFGKRFDVGLALDPTTPNTQHVLVLYGSDTSLPSRYTAAMQQSLNDTIHSDSLSPLLSVDDAMANCQTVKLVVTQPTKKLYRKKKKLRHDAECLAILSQWESPHVHTFRQTSSTNNGTSESESLTRAWGYTASRPDLETILPEHVQANNQALVTYLTAIPSALKRLETILQQASIGRDNKPSNTGSKGSVIVMVCNHGQANLLTNFVCAARARSLDTSRIVVFATDAATERLAKSLGLHVFADDVIFGGIPQQAAHNYLDTNFGLVMMAKVYCVHLTLLLGYDVLFQDVDIVWYQSPLDYFHNLTTLAETEAFDIYFQHDGFHHPERFKPIAANTGLYFVRHNSKTRHLMDFLARMGDHVLATKSHQATMTVLVNEHMSTYGLRVKVLGEEADLFPNGYALQKGKKITRYMREENATKPILFHANWLAKNKKRPAFEGTLNWYLGTQCFDADTDELHRNLSDNVMDTCCLATPCCAS